MIPRMPPPSILRRVTMCPSSLLLGVSEPIPLVPSMTDRERERERWNELSLGKGKENYRTLEQSYAEKSSFHGLV